MKSTEFITEDDYYPREVDNSKSEEELQAFLDQHVENHLGAPHQATVRRDMGVIVSVPRRERMEYEGWREDWLETADDLIDELYRADFGSYERIALNPKYIELEKSRINETTTAGGIATVASAQGSALTRNASIYGTPEKKKKKKKTGKYVNSKQD